jgi:hypothetical protein
VSLSLLETADREECRMENQELLRSSFSLCLSLEKNMWEKRIVSMPMSISVMGICVCEKAILFMGISVTFTFEGSDLFCRPFKKKTKMNST